MPYLRILCTLLMYGRLQNCLQFASVNNGLFEKEKFNLGEGYCGLICVYYFGIMHMYRSTTTHNTGVKAKVVEQVMGFTYL